MTGMTTPNDETRRIVDDLEDEVVDVDQAAAEGDTGDATAAEDTSSTTPGAEPTD